MDIKIGCVLMAAGNSVRFEENKLLTDIDGRSVISIALGNIPTQKLTKTVVVSQYDSILDMAQKQGHTVIKNEHPEYGLSHTIELGLGVTDDCDATLFMVADQPRLKIESVERLIDAYAENPKYIASLSYEDKRGNPCIFPSVYYDKLRALSGDKGGSVIIKEHKENTLLVKATDRAELVDVDTREDLEMLSSL